MIPVSKTSRGRGDRSLSALAGTIPIVECRPQRRCCRSCARVGRCRSPISRMRFSPFCRRSSLAGDWKGRPSSSAPRCACGCGRSTRRLGFVSHPIRTALLVDVTRAGSTKSGKSALTSSSDFRRANVTQQLHATYPGLTASAWDVYSQLKAEEGAVSMHHGQSKADGRTQRSGRHRAA